MKLLHGFLRIRHARPFAWLTLPTRRRRRMAVAALWGAFAAHVAVNALGGDGRLAGFAGFATLLAGLVCLFSLAEASALRGGARPLDAGRLAARDRAYAAAFQGTGWLLLAVVVYAELALRIDALWLPSDPRGAVGAFAAVAVAIGLLPVSLLSWTEPDDAPAAAPAAPQPPRRPRRFAAGPVDREGTRFLH
ncbi:MAG TPA: hypothetical protein VF006_07740 [Longimicrobium sp.]